MEWIERNSDSLIAIGTFFSGIGAIAIAIVAYIASKSWRTQSRSEQLSSAARSLLAMASELVQRIESIRRDARIWPDEIDSIKRKIDDFENNKNQRYDLMFHLANDRYEKLRGAIFEFRLMALRFECIVDTKISKESSKHIKTIQDLYEELSLYSYQVAVLSRESNEELIKKRGEILATLLGTGDALDPNSKRLNQALQGLRATLWPLIDMRAQR